MARRYSRDAERHCPVSSWVMSSLPLPPPPPTPSDQDTAGFGCFLKGGHTGGWGKRTSCPLLKLLFGGTRRPRRRGLRG